MGRARELLEDGVSGRCWDSRALKALCTPQSTLWGTKDSQGDLKVKPFLSQ